jgi:hypothetical protein
VNPFWFFVSTGEPKLIRSFAHSNDPLAQASCSGMKPEKKIIFVRSSFCFYLAICKIEIQKNLCTSWIFFLNLNLG